MTFNPATPGTGATSSTEKSTLFDYTRNTSEFKTFSRVVDAAGLSEQLKSPGPYTLFAPTDEAFGRLPKGTLETLLKEENKGRLATMIGQHILPEKISTGEITTPREARTLAGPPARLASDHGTIMVGDAHVVRPVPATCSNGYVYAVDRVNIPAA